MEPLGALEPPASKVHDRWSHEDVKAAVGGLGAQSVPQAASRTRLIVFDAVKAWSVDAASPPAVPAATGPPLSAVNELIRPDPVPICVSRGVTPLGADHAVTTEDFTTHDDTSQSLDAGTATVGVVALVALTFVVARANPATGVVGSTPEYAARCTVPFTWLG